MVDESFFSKKGPYSLEEVARIGSCEFNSQKGHGDIIIHNVATIEKARPGEITFLTNVKYLKFLENTKASACIADIKLRDQMKANVPLIFSENPYKSYALIVQSFYPKQIYSPEISKLAYIDESAKVGKNCTIKAFVNIGKNVLIGNNVYIESGVHIGSNVVIGDDCYISSNSVIQYSLIGNNVIIHPGVKIGQDGFGFASDTSGHIKVPQIGRVIIGDNVEIGANTCIDRGAIDDTLIGDGTQIDNLVQIGHNVQIGRNCVIVSQVGIAGSTKIGDFTVIGGQAGIAGHVDIGAGAQIAAKSGVTKRIKPGEIVGGFPAISLIEWKKQIIAIKKLALQE